MLAETDPGKAPNILIVDDDTGLRDCIADYLNGEGYSVACAPDAPAMDRSLNSGQVDLMLLDVMLPGEDGLSICRRVVDEHGPPIIMLSAAGEEIDRVIGLELGADDYLAKPCSPRELLARIRAVLRRRTDAAAPVAPPRSYQFSGYTLDVPRRALRGPDGATILLSAGEVALLLAFVAAPRQILSRDKLIESTIGAAADVFDRAIDVQISRLRRKLNHDPLTEVIRTVRGLGYIFDVKVTRN
jgi:two-component system, OmpR family, response regulator